MSKTGYCIGCGEKLNAYSYGEYCSALCKLKSEKKVKKGGGTQ